MMATLRAMTAYGRPSKWPANVCCISISNIAGWAVITHRKVRWNIASSVLHTSGAVLRCATDLTCVLPNQLAKVAPGLEPSGISNSILVPEIVDLSVVELVTDDMRYSSLRGTCSNILAITTAILAHHVCEDAARRDLLGRRCE